MTGSWEEFAQTEQVASLCCGEQLICRVNMAFLELLKAVLLGIVQGITEWLPVSSTGHMILLDEFITLQVSDAFREMFFVVIQLGSVAAVAVIYFDRLNPFSKKKTPDERMRVISLWLKVCIAGIPAGIIGVFLNDIIDAAFYNYVTVFITLIAYGVLFIVLERRNRKKKPVINSVAQMNWKTALYIGMFQVLSLIPGTSRSGSTILGAMLLGLSRKTAAEFSFFLAIPMMLGASGVKILKSGLGFSGLEWSILLVGMVTAFAVSIFAIRFLMNYIKKHDFTVFGWYRIVLGFVVLLYFLFTAA